MTALRRKAKITRVGTCVVVAIDDTGVQHNFIKSYPNAAPSWVKKDDMVVIELPKKPKVGWVITKAA